MCVCVYVYIYTFCTVLPLYLYVYIYRHIHAHHTYIYTHTCIHETEREDDRVRAGSFGDPLGFAKMMNLEVSHVTGLLERLTAGLSDEEATIRV